jgi:hypothetical protein
MTLPASGSISTDDIMTELRTANPGRAYPISTSDADVLTLAGKTAGQSVTIPNDFWGKSAAAFAGYIPDVQMTALSNPATSRTETKAITANVSGGSTPLSFAWSHVSGPGSVDAVNSATSTARMPNPRFSEPGVSMQVVQCVVTDSTGKTLTLQGNVTLTLT